MTQEGGRRVRCFRPRVSSGLNSPSMSALVISLWERLERRVHARLRRALEIRAELSLDSLI